MPLRFGKEPNTNQSYCVQDKNQRGFQILADDKKTKLYFVNSKIATTSSSYQIIRSSDSLEIAFINRIGREGNYSLKGADNNLLGKITFSNNSLEIQIGSEQYHGKVYNRAKEIEIYDKQKKLTATIDKKILSFKDSYRIVSSESFPHLIAQMIAVVVDDYYHDGPSN